ncbi:MAG TPA: 3-hydroxyacyl-CoA dehydrogenase NAD-binding domain-containing protein [Vicinamibacterales bacterium]
MIHYEIRDAVAVITIDNPPVNALGPGVLEGIEAAVARGVSDSSVKALVLIGAGETFVAGADINIFKTMKTREQSRARSEAFHASLKNIENATKPVVAAIHGNALGGGLELAMSCHDRIALSSARVGQPEVLLGLIPGAGGTQRLPRLCGVPLALDMCIEGKPVPAATAHAARIIDQLIEGNREALLTGAVAFARARAGAGEIRRTRELSIAAAEVGAALAACDARRAQLGKAPTPVLAPYAAVDAIKAAVTLPFDEGSAVERELFADCLVSTESRALVHLFFAEREAAKVPGVPRDTPARDIRRAAIVGAGTMGGGIAMTYANAGIPVLLKDVDEGALARGMATIRKNYESTVAKGRMTADALERTMALITPTTTYDGFDAVDVVVEAVFEDLALKTSTFADLGRVTRQDAVLASNTSTLDIDALARASGRAPNVIGHHFFSPANVMKLVEIVRGRDTGPETIATSQKLAKRLGKVGVVVGNCFGFVANRMLLQYLRQAYLLLGDGASVAQIDRVMTSFGMPVGPFGMEDIAGLDVGARIRQHLRSTGGVDADWPESEIATRLVEMGRYGQKTGAGWYRYEPGNRTPLVDPLVDTLANDVSSRRGVTRRVVPDEEILARVTTALANEGARVLEEGFANRASDIDVIYCYGFGFPRYRGGPMFYADSIGLPTVLARIRTYGWKPAPLIEKLASQERGFYSEVELS